ncbi:hypothetical protein V0M98_37065 (plasmid) [Pseudomonas silesiensis]|uniref:hypothetical protein n=1 Tax=Pseudomonas silesiensis TaxID=1853130 RepID=UPI0030CBBA74
MANHNIAAVNRQFRKALYEPVISLYHYNGCGFFDGGCLLLADALVQWSDGDLNLGAIDRVSNKSESGDHWFVSMNVAGRTFLLDANGLKLPAPYRRYFEKEEVREPCVFLENPQHKPDSEVPRDAAFSKILCNQLITALGTYPHWKAEVQRVFEPEESPSPR